MAAEVTGSGSYELVDRNSGKAPETRGASTANEAVVDQSADCRAANRQ